MNIGSPRQLLTRAGTGAAVVALVAVTGYSIGQTQAVRATAAAAPVNTSAPVAAPAVTTSYASVVDAAAPAVVTVRVAGRAKMVPTQMPGLPDDPLFREFFGRRFGGPQQPRQAPRISGLGSGVIATADGFILTNNHVVEGADTVKVELTNRRSFDAKVVGTDPATDLALLKINANNLPTLAFGDSSRVKVGDVVLAIGNPLNVGQTVTMGIVSAKGRSTNAGESYEDFIQTDAPINEGNSGGALISATGELVGINSQILTPSGGNIGLGFAIPSNMARQVMDQLRTDGKVVRGKLGVSIQNVTADLASSLKLSDVGGALISSVTEGSAAERAGLKQGDVIVGINGEKISDNNALRNRIASTRPGTKVAIDIVRDGKPQTVHATVDQLDAKEALRSARSGDGASNDAGGFGLTVEPLTADAARALGLRQRNGVLIAEVDPDGAAAAAGLQENDVILQVNGRTVKDPSELKAVLTTGDDRPVLLLVARRDAQIFVTLKKN
jgi:serine protease Do